jgi:hypothetical protein
MTNTEKLSTLIRHIKMVEANCNLISRYTMEKDPEFAIAIAKRGRTHDLTKFDSLEFENLWKGEKNFDIAIVHHHTHNRHHPEHFSNGIYGMDLLDLVEMICDVTARSQEFGTDVRIWLLNKAAIKYGYMNDSEMLLKIEYYINILLNQPFQ